MFTLVFSIFAVIWGISLFQKWATPPPLIREPFFESQLVKSRESRIKNGLPYFHAGNYQRYLHSVTWQVLSTNAKMEMGYRCEFCGNPAEAVHHVYYPKNRHDFGLEDIASLCVVCKKCHDILHGNRAENVTQCALCEKNKASDTFIVRHNKLGMGKQSVCEHCKLLAEGQRDKANEISWTAYVTWVDEWQRHISTELLSKQRYFYTRRF